MHLESKSKEEDSIKEIKYKLDLNEISFEDIIKKNPKSIKNQYVFMIIDLDSMLKNDKEIVLNLIVKDSKQNIIKQNTADNQSLTLTISSSGDDVIYNKYKYLSYLGTNFDLVEGIKANNLFFATNIYFEPQKNRYYGIYLSLYGNRALSYTDNLGVRTFVTGLIEEENSENYYVLSTVESLTVTRTTDNLGAHFSLLFPVFGRKKDLNVYLIAATDFIWKRNNMEIQYGEVVDTVYVPEKSISITEIQNLENKKFSIDEYAFNVGTGFFVSLEDDNISVRIQGTVGYGSNAISNLNKGDLNFPITDDFVVNYRDMTFLGRAWITEPKTGITLQAEIMNRLKSPSPSYVVTLSKAFQLDKLGGLFAPITDR